MQPAIRARDKPDEHIFCQRHLSSSCRTSMVFFSGGFLDKIHLYAIIFAYKKFINLIPLYKSTVGKNFRGFYASPR